MTVTDKPEKSKSVKLKVAEAIQDDVNKGIVRIDSTFMHQINVRPWDIVEIEGERKTVSIVDRAYPGDIGLNIIRMDGIVRRNAQTGLGELVTIKKANVVEAKKVIIAPQRKGVLIRANPTIFKQGLLDRAVVKGDLVSLGRPRRRAGVPMADPLADIFNIFDMGFGLADFKFVVVDANPKQAVLITEQTEVQFNPEATEVAEERVLEVTYEDIGGLGDELKKIREMVELPLKHPELFEALGIEPPKGVLLHGPPGTGKTLLAKAVANETSAKFFLINGPEIMSKYYGQSEENLRKIFGEAEKDAPAIIFIDEIDAIASKREESRGEVERRVVAQLLALMDGLKGRGKIVVIGATNIPNELDPALRRPGRFDRELEIGVPDKDGRRNILKIHTRTMPIISEEIYPEILEKKVIQRLGRKYDEIENDYLKLQNKIKELKSQKEAADSSIAQSVINKIKGVESKIKEVEINLNKIKTVKKQISEEKRKFSSLIRQLRAIYDITDLYSGSDPRKTILDNVNEPKEKKIIENLLDLGIITEDLKNDCLKEGAQRDLDQIAEITHGFVGADLAALAKESAMNLLRSIYPDLKLEEDQPIPKESLEKLKVTKKHFFEALKVVRPSAMREVLVEIPNVKWGDIGGLDDVKQELAEAIEWPLNYPDSFKRLGVKPPRGILLYGAPGTGKTMLAKAVANESKSNFILVKGPELISKWVGESEKGVRKIFDKARQTAPTIIFFDEIDSLAPRRSVSADTHVSERVVNQLLTEMQGLEELHDVVVLAATNRPDMLDTALLRPGRFDRIILTPVPDEKTRAAIFKVHTKGMPISVTDLEEKELEQKLKNVNIEEAAKAARTVSKIASDESINEKDLEKVTKKPTKETKTTKYLSKEEKLLCYLAEKTEGYAGADIEAVCREAAILALREDIEADKISMKHFEDALGKVRPSATKDIEKAYQDLQNFFRSAKGKEMKEEKPSYMM